VSLQDRADAPGTPDAAELFGRLYVPVDGSPLGHRAATLATELAGRTAGTLIASHAYAAKLHDRRFRQMEGGLPDRYQVEQELQRQREVHDDLIGRGLGLISDSYLDRVGELADAAGVPMERRCVEGRNWRVLLDDVVELQPDLVLLGALGLGRVPGQVVGSVCERLVRRLGWTDALITRQLDRAPWQHMVVAVDGSGQALGAVRAACLLARTFGGRVDLLSSFDPHFHHSMFGAISDALSEEAAKVFRFEEQQLLHEELIDGGLARIYRDHLDAAARYATSLGVEPGELTLRAGKATACVLEHVEQVQPSMLLLGRTGVHSDGDLDLGSCPERVLRADLPCDLYLAARTAEPLPDARDEALPWTAEATALLDRAPEFVRKMVAGAVTRQAREAGHTVVTSDLVKKLKDSAMPSRGGPPGEQPAAHPEPVAAPEPTAGLPWTAEAEAILARIPEGFMREQAREAFELRAGALGKETVDDEAARAQYEAWGEGGAKTSRELVWDDDVLARIQRIPDFVRGGVVAEVERRARDEDRERIDRTFYDRVRADWKHGADFHDGGNDR
jgi:nucleotide-binding universal stress UspA family protein